ncbi:PDZ domain-containing protein [Streptomyces sp. 1114.5]|uniref:S16 family serine protease n=1 Tax=unclassified Streptomyces TaxID=2593676 RepID=UPI000BD6B5C7|nr:MULTISPECIES: S16 family serine protease [unclassified Streptomyces]RKT17690.1 PDZ domain-containing protein [Streptomyces sp. 1114.5]SOB83894.1 PDZ domain-containing protein [Streptomyces sp. 1331.2]
MSDTKLPQALTSPRTRALALCGLLVASLFGVAAFVPLPYTITWPGSTADTLGTYQDKPVLTITGAPLRTTEGQLRMVTITATNADQRNTFLRSMQAWFDPKEAVRPTDTVYAESDPAKANEVIAEQMAQSQDSATAAALNYLHLSPDQVKVKVDLGDVGGPSAGQMLALGIVDKLAGDGKGGDLTGGLTVAGTGTIDKDGTIGPVGGVPLKTQAAARDGATVFLLPRDECTDAKVNLPGTLRLVPVGTLGESVAALQALKSGGSVPSC